MRIHRVYCKSLSGPNKKFKLDEPQSHHLIKALRIKQNDVVEVFDGIGGVAKCEVSELSKKNCTLTRLEDVLSNDVECNLITAIIPVIKRSNFNFMLQKMSEIGVNNFLIYRPENIDQSVAKKDLYKFVERSQEIVISVCKQCGNNHLPTLETYSDIKSAVNAADQNSKMFVFDTDASDYFDAKEINKDDNVTIISGPESGFSQQELNFLLKNKIMNRYLGKNILRSETAPVVVAAIIRNHFGKIT